MDDALFAREAQLFQRQAQDRKKKRAAKRAAAPFEIKYRPTQLSEVIGHRVIIERFKRFVEDGAIPNMLFDGPPGVGKTTCGVCLAHALLVEDYKRGFLWLNASDSRSATYVAKELRTFVMKQLTLTQHSKHTPKRIVFLDEVDSMTPDAQRLLKGLMERSRDTTRFILACNESAKIYESLQAMCVRFNFGFLDSADVSKEVRRVAQLEHINLDESGFKAIMHITDGDMRRGLNALQTVHGRTQTALGPTQAALIAAESSPDCLATISAQQVFDVCEVPNTIVLEKVLCACASGELATALNHVQTLLDHGYSVTDLFKALHALVRTPDMSDIGGVPRALNASRKMQALLSASLRREAIAVVSRSFNRLKQFTNAFFNESTGTTVAATPLQLNACICGLCELLSTRVQKKRSAFVQIREKKEKQTSTEKTVARTREKKKNEPTAE